ncbi:ribonuclease HII, partial [Striga asiatica]
IIGKKSYPFSLEANDISTLTKSDQSASCTNEYTLHMEPQNKLIRDRVWYSKERNLKKLKSDNMKLNGDFLTLAPPSIVDSPPLDHSFQDRQQLSENRTGIADKESVNSGIFHRRSGLVGNSSRYFSNNLGTCQNTNYGNNGNSEKGEIVDLSLKL